MNEKQTVSTKKRLNFKWNRTATIITCALVAVIAIVVAGLLLKPYLFPDNNGVERVFGVGEEGVYYYEVVDGKVVLTLRDGTFTLSGKINKTGVYSVDGSTINLDFYKDEDGTATATINGDTLSFVYNDANLSFLKEDEYTVTFDVNEGSEIAAVKVTNGKTVNKPAQDPVKADHVFIGWYADEALTTPFDFGAVVIKSDVTVYAKWAAKVAGVPDYVVSFDVGDYEGAEAIAPLTTVSGVAYGMPAPEREGYTFGGWWFSMYEDGAKLSHMYKEGTVFTKDTTLYAIWYEDASSKLNAPAVNVSENMISWESVSGATSYKLTVIKPDGTAALENETVTGIMKEFKFSELEAGEYKISVVAVANKAEENSESADRYFANKTLDKVSEFYVENGILIFGAVENAEKYIVNIVCGNANHSHTNFDNGPSTTYYLANCQMQEGGILITVTASAEGYASSVSNVFVYNKLLAAVENLKYDAANDKFVWNTVAGATNYKVTVTVGQNEYTFDNGAINSFSVAGFTGNIEVSVVPVSEGFNSPAAVSASCQKTAPAAPAGVAVSGNVVSWNAVDGAAKYEVVIGDKTVQTENTSLNIATAALALVQGQTYSVQVKAINANGESSSYSKAIEIGYFVMSSKLTYAQNTVYWSPVLGADQYQVRVNGGEAINVTGASSAKVTLTQEGENLIEVRYVYGTTFSDWASITVNAFAVEYDTRTITTGALIVEYLAVGDIMSLPTEGFSFEGYDFTGWYNAPKGALGNGKLYGEGSVFNGNAYTVVYAEWTPKTYQVTLKFEGLGFNITNLVSGTKESVTYTKDFQLTVPKAQDTGMYFFAGWYTGTSGTGTKVTDENGVSVVPYNFPRDITLYPYYSTNALAFTLQDDGTYAVSKGETIASVSNLKIPATYNEIPVTVVLENAFSSCTTLVKIEIPDTIKLVGTGAFNGCSNLEYIDVYVAKPGEEGTYETFYSDDNGVLIREDMGTTWLEFVPRAMTGEYTIPETVEMILPKAFYMTKISKVIIPTSINELPEYAFYSCTSLEEVVFEGGRVAPIVLTKNSFYFPSYNSKIKSITFPAKMTIEFSVLRGVLNYYTELTSITVEKGGDEYSSIGGILTDADEKTMLYCPRGYAGDLSIPQGVTAIGEKAFEYCDLITSVTIPVWVTDIGAYAFQYNDGIKSVTFEGARSEDLSIGDEAFWAMGALETVTFKGNGTDELDKGQITMGRLAFYGSASSSKLHTVTIGDGVNIASFGEQAFQTQGKLTTFSISDKAYVGSIGTKAFEKCVSLTSFTVPATVESIAANAFNGCVKLATLEFATAEGEPELEIADLAFNGCTALKAVQLPDRLKAFEASAFEGCSGLTAFTVTDTNEKYVTDVNGILYAKNLDENDNVVFTELLFYPKALVAENGGVINNLPESLVIIGGSAFSDNPYLTSIVIPANVTSIGVSAFANCENLESVQFNAAAAADGEEMALTIGDSAFINCASLTDDFRLPAYTTSIGYAAFQGCTFTKFVIPEGVTYIGKAAFWGIETLTSVEFKTTGDLIIENGTANNATGGGAFASTGLTHIELPATLVELGNYAFYKCYALETVTIGNVTVEDDVYTVESKLIRIGNRAFEQCVALKSIIIPKSVTAIGTSAFAATEKVTAAGNPGPGSLTDVIFEKGGTEELAIAGNVFWWQPNLTVLNFPERVSFYASNTNLQRKQGSTALKDANGNSLYNAPTASITLNITGYKETFKGCYALKEINIEDDANYTGLYATIDGVLYSADKTVLVYCPAANVGVYKDGEPTYEIIVPTSVQLLLTYSFENTTELQTITFEEFDKEDENYGKQLLTIGNYANTSGSNSNYYTIGGANNNVTTVNLPSHLAKITYNAFMMGADHEELEPMVINFNPDAKDVVIDKYAFWYSTVQVLNFPGIKSIGDYAFGNSSKLETVTFGSLSSTFKKLPNYMFQNDAKLTGFTIPAQITELGTYVFSGCASITSLEIPETLTKIGNYAFGGTGLTSVTLHSKFTNSSFGTYLFNNCVNLKTVTFLPKEDGTYPITQLPDQMFYGCTALDTINIYDFADKITKIGKSTFNKCESLAAFDFTKFTSLTTLGTQTFSYNPNYVKVDLSKTKITDFSTAFNNLPNLTEFIYPETLSTETNSSAFTNCPKLSTVYLTKSFKSTWMANVNARIVQKSNVPVNVILPAENLNFSIDEFGVVYDPDQQIIYFVSPTADLSEYTIPETVLTIGKYAFAYNKSLKTIVIPEGVTKIEASAFEQSGLTHVVIPATVTLIDDYAFGYTPLAEFIFTDTVENPSQLTTLGSAVFRYSTIPSIVLPDKLTTFENGLFTYCMNLKSITTGASMTEIPNGFASYATSLEELNMQEGIETIRWIFSSYSYKSGYGVNKVTSLHIPASVKTIVSDAFCDFSNLKTVTFAEGSVLETIEKHAFENCYALETITGIPASLASIGESAFKNCTSLQALDLSATAVTEILKQTFYNTESMITFALPKDLTSIGEYAFYNTGIEDLTIPATVTTIGVSAFEDAGLKTITFPKASIMINLGEEGVVANIFKGTDKLETVVLPNTLQSIAAGTFENSSVQTVLMADENMPSGLTYIGASAFANCTKLTGFAYLEQVTEIGEKAFFLCSSLENTVVSEGLTSLGAMAFAFCNKLTEAYIPESLTTLGGNPYAGIDVSKLKLAEKNEAFVLETDENGVTTLYNSEKTVIYAVYGLTGAYEIPADAKGNASYAPGALAGNAITEVIVPARLEVVPDYMFMNCTALASVTMADELTAIGQYAFYNTGLTTVTIPASVTTIGDCAFMYCASINNVVMPKTVTTMGNYLFAYCTALSNFEFEHFAEGESVKVQKVGTHFFYNCPNITQVLLPDKINITDEDKAASGSSYATDIPSYMFAGTGIVNAEIPKNGSSLYFFTRGVFANCKELVSVYIEEVPDNNISSYGYCNPSYFEGCDKLEAIYFDMLDKSAYSLGAVSKWPVALHLNKSVKDEDTNQLNASAYVEKVYFEEFELHFDADTYTDIIDYFANVSDPWIFAIYDKDGNRLYCSKTDGSVAYVEDAEGNVIWGTKPAN